MKLKNHKENQTNVMVWAIIVKREKKKPLFAYEFEHVATWPTTSHCLSVEKPDSQQQQQQYK